MSATAINDAVAKALAAAAANPAPATTALVAANQNQPGSAVAIPLPAGQRMTMDDVQNGGMSVDGYVKVNHFGLQVDGKAPLVQKFKAKIDLSQVQICMSVKYGAGQNVTYAKTYDQVRTVQGGSWAEACAKAKQSEGGSPTNKTDPYMSADIPMTVLEDIVDPATKDVLSKAGRRLGYGLSTTNMPLFKDFISAVKKSNLNENTAVVEVEIGQLPRTKNSFNWGLMTFKLVGEFVEVPDAA